MTKISVIIPIYNVEKYLTECLDSVINQTYKNIEIICVNDGSTDSSLEILNSYAQKDSRMKIINKENGGLSSARNEGLKHITGELCYFLDSDDYILPNLLDYAIKVFNNFDIDYFCFSSQAFIDDDYNNDIIQNQNAIDEYIKVKYDGILESNFDVVINTNIHVWNKIFKTKLIKDNDITFIEGLLYEDIFFTWYYSFIAKNVYFEKNIFHKYRIRKNSIMESTNINKSLKTGIDHLLNWYELFKKASYNHELFIKNFDNLNCLLDMYKYRTKEMVSDDEKIYVELLAKKYKAELFNTKEKLINIGGFNNIVKTKYNFLEKIFSVKYTPDRKHKIIRFLFIKIKFKNKLKNICKYIKKLIQNKNNIKYNEFCNSNNNNSIIFETLNELGKFSFLPNRGNIGDMAIATACYQYFDTQKFNYDVIDMTEYKKFLEEKDPCVVYGGGGLFVGYYREYYQEILEIFKSKNTKKVVVLPASFYDCDDVLEILDERFTVFCREQQSLDYCLSKNNKATFILANDMALALNIDFVTKNFIDNKNLIKNIKKYKKSKMKDLYSYYESVMLKYQRVLEISNNTGYFFRTDKENIKNIIKDIYSLIDISLSANSFCADKAFTILLVREFLRMLDKYEYIVSDRLHVGICSMLLGKKVYLLDNTYKKVSKVFENSIINSTNVKIYDNFDDLQKELPNKEIFNYAKEYINPLSYEEFVTEYFSIKNNFGFEKIYWDEIL